VAVVVAPALAVAVVAWATPAPAVSMLVPLVRAVTKSRGREVTVAGPTYFSRRIGGLGFKWSLYLSCTLILSFDFAPSSACSFLRHLVMTGTRNDGQGQNIIHSFLYLIHVASTAAEPNPKTRTSAERSERGDRSKCHTYNQLGAHKSEGLPAVGLCVRHKAMFPTRGGRQWRGPCW